mgnify:CR=1 FL=1
MNNKVDNNKNFSAEVVSTDSVVVVSSNSVEGDKYDVIVKGLIEKLRPLIRRWKARDIGDWNSWLQLLQKIMGMVQSDLVGEGGVVKSAVAIDVIQGLAQILIDENVANLNEQQMGTVKLVLSDEGANLMKASTGFLKNLMKMMDTNRDGKISGDEFKSFWKKYFCCCC